MTKDWTIEATYLQPAKDLYWNELPEGIAPMIWSGSLGVE